MKFCPGKRKNNNIHKNRTTPNKNNSSKKYILNIQAISNWQVTDYSNRCPILRSLSLVPKMFQLKHKRIVIVTIKSSTPSKA